MNKWLSKRRKLDWRANVRDDRHFNRNRNAVNSEPPKVDVLQLLVSGRCRIARFHKSRLLVNFSAAIDSTQTALLLVVDQTGAQRIADGDRTCTRLTARSSIGLSGKHFVNVRMFQNFIRTSSIIETKSIKSEQTVIHNSRIARHLSLLSARHSNNSGAPRDSSIMSPEEHSTVGNPTRTLCPSFRELQPARLFVPPCSEL
jgi:hypothetical protein